LIGIGGDDEKMIGLTGGGQAIQRCREKFKKFLKMLVDIASLQVLFVSQFRLNSSLLMKSLKLQIEELML
jgi:hypothetical protein